MKYEITYNKAGRIRARFGRGAFDKYDAAGMKNFLNKQKFIKFSELHPSNGSILIQYEESHKGDVIKLLKEIDKNKIKSLSFPKNTELEKLNKETKNKIIKMFTTKYIMKSLFSLNVMKAVTVIKAIPFIKRGISELISGKLNIEVLDATSIITAILLGKHATAANVMFLLKTSSILENHTINAAKLELAKSMAINVDYVWVEKDGSEIKKSISELEIGDLVTARMGSIIPVDGTVKYGEGIANEASMTGESLPIDKHPGSTCFAGTILEEGELKIEVTALQNETRIHKILDLIDKSQEYKAEIQKSAQSKADKLVPFSLLFFFGTFAFTQNATRAMAVLMVDYSCAIKLFTPITVISAMREAAERGIAVKGGKFLEEYSKVNAAVFDKTGTLTKAHPELKKIIPTSNRDENELLKIAACLEEHFPHSVANAIVSAAENEGVYHGDEKHGEVEYIVAHGIVSNVDGKRIMIGSRHFIEKDEKIEFNQKVLEGIIEANGYSTLFLAHDKEVIGIFCISDPPREESKYVVESLRKFGINDIMMLTGDSELSAKQTCELLNINQYKSQVLPDEKYLFVNELKGEGKRVLMVGDGVNDSPALSSANVSVAMNEASDIAREVADITLLSNDLRDLIYLRHISERLMKRIERSYAFIIGFNSSLILAGLTGVLMPETSALLHNLSTIGICAYGSRPLIKDREVDL